MTMGCNIFGKLYMLAGPHENLDLSQYIADCSLALNLNQPDASKSALFLGGKALLAEGEAQLRSLPWASGWPDSPDV